MPFEWHPLHALVLVHFFSLDCVFSGYATCSLPLTSAMVQSGIMILFSLSSDMDEISVVFESIMESCAFGENSCEFEDEKKRLVGRP
jgi:hypothetical protein